MDQGKLFHVLVIGGALLGTGCRDETSTGTDAGPSVDGGTANDAATAIDAGAASDGGAPTTDAALMECGFCPNEECCVTDDAGASHLRDGMMCCWSTSC